MEAPATTPTPARRERFRAGVRAGLPYAVAGFVISMSFGVLAQQAGFSGPATFLFSAVVFAGSAQFSALAIIASGGSLGAALAAAAMVNSRFLPMGIALAPSLPGRALWRAAQGQTIVDASWAMSLNADGTFDRDLLFGATAIQYLTWTTGTLTGVLAGNAMGDPNRLGLDATFPAFFVALLISEMRDGRSAGVAALGAGIALVLIPLTPVGVPVLVASVAALVGLYRRDLAPDE